MEPIPSGMAQKIAVVALPAALVPGATASAAQAAPTSAAGTETSSSTVRSQPQRDADALLRYGTPAATTD
jgi:hypothetical protein